MDNNGFNNDYNSQNEQNGGDNLQYAYQSYMEVRSKSRGFAVASLVLGILSIVCCCLTYAGLAMAVLAIIFAAVSRKKMGYFDPLALAGLILGIIGAVFGVSVIVTDILSRAGAFDAYLEEYFKQFEDLYGDPNDTTSGF